MRTALSVIGITMIGTLLVGTGVMVGNSSSGRAALAAPAMQMSMPGMASSGMAPARINLVIVPDALMGSNKKTHDAFVPAFITAKAGQQVVVTVYNLDTAPHSFTAAALGINVIVPGAASAGAVGSKTFSFTAGRAGTYHWKCILPCDNGGVNAWAMTHDGYMAGTITIQS